LETYLKCVPCLFSQASRACRQLGLDDDTGWQIIQQFSREFADLDMTLPPPVQGSRLYDLISRVTGRVDPYADIKVQSTVTAHELLKECRHRLVNSSDPVGAALRASAAGNIIDFGADLALGDLAGAFHEALDSDLAGGGEAAFRQSLSQLRRNGVLLMIGDNAGETVFDAFLLERIADERPDLELVYACREKPAINDAVISDCLAAGIADVAGLISSGSCIPGTWLPFCTPRFQELFRTADLVISKGQGNFETLCGEDRKIFFLLKVKCPVVSEEIGLPLRVSAFVERSGRGMAC
jgi:hypothetical protein